jgi:amylosucrase
MGGIPLLYLGDELATLNDYGYRDDPAHAADSRWAHRPRFDPAAFARRLDPSTIEGRLFTRLKQLIEVRTTEPAFAVGETTVFDPGSDHVFAYVRRAGGRQVLALANLTETPQTIAANVLRVYGQSYAFTDLVDGEAVSATANLVLGAYQFVWLTADTPDWAGGWQGESHGEVTAILGLPLQPERLPVG